MNVDPDRVIAELRELAQLTSDDGGAQRVAWTPTWQLAREWLKAKLAELPVTVDIDEAGNLWAGSGSVLVGSHIDSVPDGGWLDGALGVVAALEMLRVAPVRLVDWADEEGARFGHSLFGSSAATGALDIDAAAVLRDAEGLALPDVLAQHGVDLARVGDARARLAGIACALELHIEQGPVLEAAGAPIGIPTGTLAVNRRRLTLVGEAAHAGAAPMHLRRDPMGDAARIILEAHAAAREREARATIGSIVAHPGIPTAVPASVELTVDLRAQTDAGLAELVAAVLADGEWEQLWTIPAVEFDASLTEGVEGVRLPSGALHDSAMLARAGIPAAMIFVRSIGGVSHSPLEDSSEADIAAGVRALAAVVSASLAEVDA